MMRRRSRVSLLIGVLVGGAGSWWKVPVALTAAGAPSRTTNQSSWVLLPVPGAGKIFWEHGLPGDSTGAVSWTSCLCSLLFGKPVEIPQYSSWTSCSCTSLLGTPVETPQVPFFFFLGQGFLVVVSGAVGQTMQNTVENPQLQFWDKVFMPVCCVWCLWPDSVGTVEDSTAAVLGQGVHACCCWSGAHGQTAS